MPEWQMTASTTSWPGCDLTMTRWPQQTSALSSRTRSSSAPPTTRSSSPAVAAHSPRSRSTTPSDRPVTHFSLDDFAHSSGLDPTLVRRVLLAFGLPEANDDAPFVVTPDVAQAIDTLGIIAGDARRGCGTRIRPGDRVVDGPDG